MSDSNLWTASIKPWYYAAKLTDKKWVTRMWVKRQSVLSCLGSSVGQGNGCGPPSPPRPAGRRCRCPPSAAATLLQVPMLVHHVRRYMPPPRIVRLEGVGLNRLYTGPSPTSVYNWVRPRWSLGVAAQEKMSLFSLKHPRVADHTYW